MRLCLTIDTEMSMGAHNRGTPMERNFEFSIEGRCADGEFGAFYQARAFRERELTGVFFVDPLPSMIGGSDSVGKTVGRLLDLDQDVQLHVHTEWLTASDFAPIAGRIGNMIADYDLDTQTRILQQAADLLVEAGAPFPTAFRAGNYGANDDTLTALARIGIRFDSSFDTGYGHPMIGLPLNQVSPVERNGVVEFPLSALLEGTSHRHLQVCAVTAHQMQTALVDAARQGHTQQTVLSHSFELLTRDRRRVNPVHLARFHRLCDFVQHRPDLFTTGPFVELLPARRPLSLPVSSSLAALHRRASQALKILRYERAYLYARLRGDSGVAWGGPE